MGLLDPVSWRKSRWTMARAAMINGRMKWKVKNRVRVALSTENPPQIHSTRFVPMYGIAERRLISVSNLSSLLPLRMISVLMVGHSL